jgi:hypothetical protein
MNTLIALAVVTVTFEGLYGGTNQFQQFDGEEYWGSDGMYIERSGARNQTVNSYLAGKVSNHSGENVLFVDAGSGEYNYPDMFTLRFDETVRDFQMVANTSYTWKMVASGWTQDGSLVDQSVAYGEGFVPGAPMQLMTLGGEIDYITVVSISPQNMFGNFILDDLSWTNNSAEAVESVPVPAAVWLFISGLLGLTVVARARRA